MGYALALAAVSFLLAVALGSPLIAFLRQRRIGKNIRVEGPERHQAKMGTPTMGGVLIVAVTLVVNLAGNLVDRWSMLLPLGVLLAAAALGAVDDLHGLVGRGHGLRARTKLLAQVALAATAGFALYGVLGRDQVYLPTVPTAFHIGPWIVPVAVLTMVGTANAINLTDGLDSLAGVTSAVAFAAYGIIASLQGQTPLVVFCFTMVGAILGFLWYNAHPALVFMGDAGSLALGMTLALVAMMTGHVVLLPVIGALFVAETLSVMLQVAYFKLTGGRRLFKMTPLHHHFEIVGWSETQVAQRFWLLGMLAAIVGVALALA